MLVTIFKT